MSERSRECDCETEKSESAADGRVRRRGRVWLTVGRRRETKRQRGAGAGSRQRGTDSTNAYSTSESTFEARQRSLARDGSIGRRRASGRLTGWVSVGEKVRSRETGCLLSMETASATSVRGKVGSSARGPRRFGQRARDEVVQVRVDESPVSVNRAGEARGRRPRKKPTKGSS